LWSIWTMNITGLLLGLLLATKYGVRRLTSYQPAAWRSGLDRRMATRALAWLTVLLLAYVLVSAINSRATFSGTQGSFIYREAVTWLPHSLDSSRTWDVFWRYLALACSFWAVRDWLLTKSPSATKGIGHDQGGLLIRFSILGWVLALNGAALSIEGIAQRLEGSGELLFMVRPCANPGADAQFGPWAYRGNAATYFNLLWPLCLGFWARVRDSKRHPKWQHHVLVACTILMASAPVVSSSRGGAVITVALLIACALVVLGWSSFRPHSSPARRKAEFTGILILFIAAPMIGSFLGGKTLLPRLAEFRTGLEIREQMNISARPMASDYPLYGTGAGTFESVFQLYRISPETLWPAQLHNDWLETRITFGWTGCGLILLALIAMGVGQLRPGALRDPMWCLTMCAVTGVLIHARWDFPFQIYSVLFLFTVVCAIFSSGIANCAVREQP
jgi:hypothetical protein